jgi:hemoglobin
MSDALGPLKTPFDALGGEAGVRAISKSFYDAMERLEPELTELHARNGSGLVPEPMRERFALFFIGWLGGPQTYVERHGHPRLRMRHGHVAINEAMRDAWMRAMTVAMEENNVTGELRSFLDQKLGDLATFLRNQEG